MYGALTAHGSGDLESAFRLHSLAQTAGPESFSRLLSRAHFSWHEGILVLLIRLSVAGAAGDRSCCNSMCKFHTTELCNPGSAHVVESAALYKPRRADFVAGTSIICNLDVQISWQVRQSVSLEVHIYGLLTSVCQRAHLCNPVYVCVCALTCVLSHVTCALNKFVVLSCTVCVLECTDAWFHYPLTLLMFSCMCFRSRTDSGIELGDVQYATGDKPFSSGVRAQSKEKPAKQPWFIRSHPPAAQRFNPSLGTQKNTKTLFCLTTGVVTRAKGGIP